MNNKSKGERGELLAANYLKSKGYEILEQNFRSGRNEIDIIARLDSFLVFVEVKSRSNVLHGYPEEMVSGEQEDRIRDVAELYVEDKQWKGNIRFDIIAIHTKKSNDLFHIRDAF